MAMTSKYFSPLRYVLHIDLTVKVGDVHSRQETSILECASFEDARSMHSRIVREANYSGGYHREVFICAAIFTPNGKTAYIRVGDLSDAADRYREDLNNGVLLATDKACADVQDFQSKKAKAASPDF